MIDFAAAAKSRQSCPTLCNPTDGSPPGSSVRGILRARTLEWVATFFSNAWKWKSQVKSLSRVRLSATPWTVAHQAPLSMGFSKQKSTGVGCHRLLHNGLWVIDNWMEIWEVIGDVVRLGNVFSCMEWHSELTYDLGFAPSRYWHEQGCKAWNDLYCWLPGEIVGVIRFR